MFGFDDPKIDRIRKRRPPSSDRDSLFGFTLNEIESAAAPRRWPWLRIAAELLVLATVVVFTAGLHFLTTTEGLQVLVDEAFRAGKMTVTLEEVEVHPDARLLSPSTWGWNLLGIRVEPDREGQPVVTIARLGVGLPDLRELWADRQIHFASLDVVGLRIDAQQQRPGKPWEPREAKIAAIRADKVRVWDLNYEAQPDPPLAAAAMRRIYGELFDVTYAPGTRELSGHGQVAIHAFKTGNLEVQHVHLPIVHADHSDIRFEGTLMFADAEAALRGTLLHFHRKAAVDLEVAVKRARVETVVERASGRNSPLLGRLDAVLNIRSGGDIPRGAGWMEGKAKLYNIRIPLGGDANDVVRDLIRITPYLTLDDHDNVLLENMEGVIRVERGAVELHELLYKAPRRTIQVFGRMDQDERYLVLRLVPARDPDVRPGVGLVLEGKDRLRIRFAKRWELLPDVYDPEPEDKAAARQLRREERVRIRRRRSEIATPVPAANAVRQDAGLSAQ